MPVVGRHIPTSDGMETRIQCSQVLHFLSIFLGIILTSIHSCAAIRVIKSLLTL